MKIRFILSVVLILLVIACKKQEEGYTIGFSYSYIDDGWGKALRSEVSNSLMLYFDENTELIIKGGPISKEQQLNDINEFYSNGIDALIVFPSDSSYLNNAIEKIYDKGIPIVVIDRKVTSTKISTFVGRDNIFIGEEAAKYAIRLLNEEGYIWEIIGTEKTSTTTDRSIGFEEFLKDYPEIKISQKFEGALDRKKIVDRIDSLIKIGPLPELIYCHNDLIAGWVHEACQKFNVDPFIIGVDALDGEGGGINLVNEGKVDVTFYNHPGGDMAMKSLRELLDGKSVPKEQMFRTFPIDSDNVAGVKKGFDIKNKQFKDISFMRKKLLDLGEKYRVQRILLLGAIAFVLLTLIFIFLLYLLVNQKNRYIGVIEEQKEEIASRIEEEQSLSEDLAKKNNMLEVYMNNLEELVMERTHKMQVALEKAKESDRLKTSFLNNFSHEVRTPLNAIIGFSNLLIEDPDALTEQTEFIHYIKNGGIELLKMINNLAEVSIISSQGIQLSSENIDICKILNDSFEEFRVNNPDIVTSKSKQINVQFKVEGQGSVSCDKRRLCQIFSCLLDNAFKFTNKGEISLGARVENGIVLFYVKDTGIGIDLKDQDKIFNNFFKIEDHVDVLYRGNGIGLYMAQKIAELFNTRIDVISKLGKGSTFSFALPLLK